MGWHLGMGCMPTAPPPLGFSTSPSVFILLIARKLGVLECREYTSCLSRLPFWVCYCLWIKFLYVQV
jgi:hypothetical protein